MVTNHRETTMPECAAVKDYNDSHIMDEVKTTPVVDIIESKDTTINRHIICIPKVNNKITKQYIFGIFCALKIGYIEKLTEVPIKNDILHKRIFVKIKWNQTPMSKYICQRFENGENVKVVYSEPWYWICVSNLSNTHY